MNTFEMNLKQRGLNCLLFLMLTTLLCHSAYCGEIHDAAGNGDLAKVKALLQANPDLVSSKDDDGLTPLHWAAMRGHKDIVEWLVAHNADINAKNKYGATPLKLAELSGHDDVEKLLHGTKSTAADLLAAVSILVEHSSPILQGADGFPVNGTVAITVDQTSGQTVVEGGDSFRGTRYEFMADNLGGIDLHVTPGQHSEFENNAKGNFVAASTSETQMANINFRMKDNLNLVNLTVHVPGRGENHGTGPGVTILVMNCTKERLRQIQVAIDDLNRLVGATTVQTDQTTQTNQSTVIFNQTESDGNGATHTTTVFIAPSPKQ